MIWRISYPYQGRRFPARGRKLAYSLPPIYKLTVSASDVREQLKTLLVSARSDPVSAHEVINLINQSGATTYILFELNRISHEAHKTIHAAALPGAARDQLEELVNGLVNSKTLN